MPRNPRPTLSIDRLYHRGLGLSRNDDDTLVVIRPLVPLEHSYLRILPHSNIHI